MYNILAIIF